MAVAHTTDQLPIVGQVARLGWFDGLCGAGRGQIHRHAQGHRDKACTY